MKSIAGFVLALIGGIGSILGSILMLSSGALVASVIPGALGALGYVPSIIAIITGGLAIWASILMKKDDNTKVKKGGIIALIVGIIGFNLLTLIGGILGMVQANK